MEVSSWKVPTGRGGTAAIMAVTNPLEGVNGEIKRRTEVVGIFPEILGKTLRRLA